MKTGIVRKVDELGRIVLPIELRRTMDIEERDLLEISTQEDFIVLRKYQPSCIFCGAEEDLIPFRNKRICRKCLQAINEQED